MGLAEDDARRIVNALQSAASIGEAEIQGKLSDDQRHLAEQPRQFAFWSRVVSSWENRLRVVKGYALATEGFIWIACGQHNRGVGCCEAGFHKVAEGVWGSFVHPGLGQHVKDGLRRQTDALIGDIALLKARNPCCAVENLEKLVDCYYVPNSVASAAIARISDIFARAKYDVDEQLRKWGERGSLRLTGRYGQVLLNSSWLRRLVRFPSTVLPQMTIQTAKEFKDLALTAADWAKRKGWGKPRCSTRLLRSPG